MMKEKNCCNYDHDLVISSYNGMVSTFNFCRVIVVTFVTSGRIASFQFPAEHFSHVFLDEAGHAVEPETIVAIAGQLVNIII
jgi:helicase MOV-10